MLRRPANTWVTGARLVIRTMVVVVVVVEKEIVITIVTPTATVNIATTVEVVATRKKETRTDVITAIGAIDEALLLPEAVVIRLVISDAGVIQKAPLGLLVRGEGENMMVTQELQTLLAGEARLDQKCLLSQKASTFGSSLQVMKSVRWSFREAQVSFFQLSISLQREAVKEFRSCQVTSCSSYPNGLTSELAVVVLSM